jgi:hypothetical protein
VGIVKVPGERILAAGADKEARDVMSTRPTVTGTRQRQAQQALDDLGPARAGSERMSVQCPRSHHVAAVYDTRIGPVILTHPGSHAHGRSDFIDTAHHAGRPADRPDLLEAGDGVDDDIPAWCDCGPVELSRTHLLSRLRAGDRKVIVGG